MPWLSRPGPLQVSLEDFQRFASLRRHMKELTVALMFFHQTTGSFTMSDFKVSALSLGHVPLMQRLSNTKLAP